MSNSVEKLAKEAERLAENLQGNPFPAFDRIAKDIRERQDNAIAMEFTKCIGELLRKNGVVPKISEYRIKNHAENHTENKIEMRYGVNIDELDFSEHDKVFEDKITDLEQRIRELIKEKNEYKRKCNNFGFKNQDLKKITKDYEDKIAKLEKEVVNRKQAFEDKCKDYKSTSELLGKYQQENESLKKRIIELENFSCQAEQETESLVEKLNQRIAELEKSRSEWIDKTVEWQQKCEKLEIKEAENTVCVRVSASPIEIATHLINNTCTINELKMIAEHINVYCNGGK